MAKTIGQIHIIQGSARTENNLNWIKIGVQGNPGAAFRLNNKPIRLGRSGIYELEGYVITKFEITENDSAYNNEDLYVDYIEEKGE